MSNVAEKFLTYVKIDTQSDRYSESTPSTKKQLKLSKLLIKELKALNLENISHSEYGYVMATLPANIAGDAVCLRLRMKKAIRFISPVLPVSCMI